MWDSFALFWMGKRISIRIILIGLKRGSWAEILSPFFFNILDG